MNSYKWAEPIFQVLPISALYRIFCEERIAIAFVIPGKPLSKKKIQY